MAKARRRDPAGTVSESAVGTMPERAPLTEPQSAGDTTAGVANRDRVAMRAYELYLARGAAEGRALDDWLAAERELTSRDINRTDDE